MKHATVASLAFVCLMSVQGASAQYTGPAQPQAAGYAGPDAIPAMTAKQLVSEGRDDQYIRLQGYIASYDGGQDYTFADESGRVSVEIAGNRFPAGQPIGADQRVELLVEVDKDLLKTEFEVERIRLLPR
jgi:uncharacterized protein (TIGR00156 family)